MFFQGKGKLVTPVFSLYSSSIAKEGFAGLWAIRNSLMSFIPKLHRLVFIDECTLQKSMNRQPPLPFPKKLGRSSPETYLPDKFSGVREPYLSVKYEKTLSVEIGEYMVFIIFEDMKHIQCDA